MEGEVHKRSNIEWFFLIAIAITIDLVQIGLDLLVGVGIVINRFIDLIVGPALFMYCAVTHIKLTVGRTVSILGTIVGEMIPVIDIAPFWTADVIFIMLSVKAEEGNKLAKVGLLATGIAGAAAGGAFKGSKKPPSGAMVVRKGGPSPQTASGFSRSQPKVNIPKSKNWQAAGFETEENANEWHTALMSSGNSRIVQSEKARATMGRMWKDAGFTPDQAREYIAQGVVNPQAARGYNLPRRAEVQPPPIPQGQRVPPKINTGGKPPVIPPPKINDTRRPPVIPPPRLTGEEPTKTERLRNYAKEKLYEKGKQKVEDVEVIRGNAPRKEEQEEEVDSA
ncbi:MAG: hypothetical protein A2664_01250 [Candidatus Taylorbacteria bacterium RIFCSPHIGHO2_01_FULL_46_22b]|uniref:Uncharacterized protein n=1 Tax=Candidatus Taylorbacteria bacterium RIFCSPHIGHO2_01_FULL_46_22b TaxID=1802301 RepID=A0A1G2M238_9BACT|nr:MAG: hypothetical protein A2664_01250 [Candidatus Taylorbacteria bacterium RIFCSPHIGHO2_01_FULL_46_22b]